MAGGNSLIPTADSYIHVSATLPTAALDGSFGETEWDALLPADWTLLEDFEEIPAHGEARDIVEFNSVRNGVRRQRSNKNPPQIDLAVAFLPTDPGQIILKAAYDAAPGATAECFSLRIMPATRLYATWMICRVSSFTNQGPGGGTMLRNLTLLPEPASVFATSKAAAIALA